MEFHVWMFLILFLFNILKCIYVLLNYDMVIVGGLWFIGVNFYWIVIDFI